MNLFIQIFLVLLLQLQQTQSSGVLTVRLSEFKNPSGRTYDGTCCDPLTDEDNACTDQCDYVMRLIVTGLGRANDHVFLFHRPIKYDSNNIEFEHSDNTLLLTVLFDRWPEDGLVKMNAFFYDYDDFDHTTTLVDWFETDLKQSNSTSPSTAVWGQFQEQTVVGNRQLDKTLLTFDWSIMEPDDEINLPTQNEYTRETKQIEYFTTRASIMREEISPQQPVATSSHFNPSENTAFYEENNYIYPVDYNDGQSYGEQARYKLGDKNTNKIDISKEENKLESHLLVKLEKVTPTSNKGDNLIETQYGVEGTLEKTEAEYSQNDVSLDLLQHSDQAKSIDLLQHSHQLKDFKHNSVSIKTPKESSKAEYDATTTSRPQNHQHSTTYRDISIAQSIPPIINNVATITTDKVLYNNNAFNKSGSFFSSGTYRNYPHGDKDSSKLETFSNDITNKVSIGNIELGTKEIHGASQNSSSLLANHFNQSNSNTALKSEEVPPKLVFHPRVPYGFTTNYPPVSGVQAQFHHGNFTIRGITIKQSNLVASVTPTSETKPVNSLHIEEKAQRNSFKHQQGENSTQEDILILGEHIVYPSLAGETINKNSVAEVTTQANVTMETYMADITSLSKLKKFGTIEDDLKKMTDSNINNTETIKNINSPKTWYNAKKFQKSNGELLHNSIQLLKAVKFQTAAPVMWFVTAQRPNILSDNQRYEIVYRTSEAFSTALTPETNRNKAKNKSLKQDILDKKNVFDYKYSNVYSQQPIIDEVINLTKSTAEALVKKSTRPSYLKNKDDSIQINSFIASPKGPHINITQTLSSQELFPNFLYNIYVPGSPPISSLNSSPFTIQAHSPAKLNITKKLEKSDNEIEFQKSQPEIQNDNGKTLTTEIKEKKNNKRAGTDNLSVSEPALRSDEKQEYFILEPTKDSHSLVSDKVKLSFKLDEKHTLNVNLNNSKHVSSEKPEVVLSFNIPDNNSPMKTRQNILADSKIKNNDMSRSYNNHYLENNITEDKNTNIELEMNKVEVTSMKETFDHHVIKNIENNGENTETNIRIDTKNDLITPVYDGIKFTVPQDATTNVNLQFLKSTNSPNSKISSNNIVNQSDVNKETKPVSRNGYINVDSTTMTATKGQEHIKSTKSYKAKDQSKSGPSSESNENMILRNRSKSDGNSLFRYDDILNSVISNEDDKLIRADALTPTLVTRLDLYQELSTVNDENNNDVFQQFEIDSKKIKQHLGTLESASYVREAELNEINTNKNKKEHSLQEGRKSRNDIYLIPEKHLDIQTTRRKSDLPIYPFVSENLGTNERMEFGDEGDIIEASLLKDQSWRHPIPTNNQKTAANTIDNKETLTEILHPHQKLQNVDNMGVTINSHHVTDRQGVEFISPGVRSNTNDEPNSAGIHHTPNSAGNHHTPNSAGIHHIPNSAGNHQTPNSAGNHHTPNSAGNHHTPNSAGIHHTVQRFHDGQDGAESLAVNKGNSVAPPAPTDDIVKHNAADPFDLMSLFRANIKLLEGPTANLDNIKVTNSINQSTVKDKHFHKPLLSEVVMQTKKENSDSGKKRFNEAEDKMASTYSLIELNKNDEEVNQVLTSLQNKQLDQNTQHSTKSAFTLTNQHNEIDQYKATSYKSDLQEENLLSLSQNEKEQVTQIPTDLQDQATNHLNELHSLNMQHMPNSAILKEQREKPGLTITENKPEDRTTQKQVTRPESDKQTTKKPVEQTKYEERTTQKPIGQTKPEDQTTQKSVEHTKQTGRTTQKPIDQTKPEVQTIQKPIKLTKLEEQPTQKPVEHTTQKPTEQSKSREESTQKPIGQIKTEERTTSKADKIVTQKPVEQTATKEGTTQKPVGQTKTEERTTLMSVQQTKPEERTILMSVQQTKPEEANTQTLIEHYKLEEGTTQNPIEQYKLDEGTTQKPTEQYKLEGGTTQKPIEQTKPEEITTQIPVQRSKTVEQAARKSMEHHEKIENTAQNSLGLSKSDDLTTLRPNEQNKAQYTTFQSIEKMEQGITMQTVGISTITSNKEDLLSNDISLETISTVSEIFPSVELTTDDKTPINLKSYQLVNSRNLKSNSLPGILHPVLYVPPTEEISKPILELPMAKQTLNTDMKTLPEDGFKLHAIVQNTANVRNQPLQNLPTLKLSEAKTGTKRTNVQNNINLDKLRNYMQVIRYRPTVQVPDRGLYTPQGETVNSTETSAPVLPKSVERYGSPYQPLVGVSTVFTRYWPAVLGVTIGTMFLLTALITSILCRQRRLLIQRARWLDSPQHLSEPPDPSEYATSSAASLTSDLTRSSVNLIGSRHGSR